MKLIGERISWKKYIYLFSSLVFLIIDIYQIVGILESNKDQTMKVIVVSIISVFVFLLILLTALEFLKGKKALLIDNDKLIVKLYSKHIINFNNIKDIKYTYNRSSKLGQYESGRITIYLNNNKVIKVDDIKCVNSVCNNLRNTILKEN